MKKPSIERPESVSEKVWKDYCTLRKAKSAPITQTAIDRIESQAKLAEISLEEALCICCAHGWQGFQASWYDRLNYAGTNKTQETTYQRTTRERMQTMAPGVARKKMVLIHGVENVATSLD